MKSIFLCLLMIAFLEVPAQNEFAATAFMNDFKKLYEDAQTGFTNYKGARLVSQYEELADEYKVKLMLPLADSGKIVVPVNTDKPYAIFYFEPSKTRLKIDQRGADLRDAVVMAFNKPLYARTETNLVNDRAWSNTWYYTDASDNQKANAIFRMSIYFNNDRYYLTLEINGKKP